MRHKRTVIIAGATGTGKTAVACALAALTGGQIISADSRQVYRHLDIGTNKAGRWDENKRVRVEKGIAQHLTDIIAPSERFSAGDFVREALRLIRELHASDILPIVTGGTGLYIKALVDGLAPLPSSDEAIRKELTEEIRLHGKEHLYERVKAIDPLAAEANRHNTQRLMRAMEVYLLTGKPISELQKHTIPPDEDFIQFGIQWERETLNRYLDRRCGAMIEDGLLTETQNVLAMGFPEDCPGLQSLGYRDIVRHLKGEIPCSLALQLLQYDTRHYAKRQMTWFRKDIRIKPLTVGPSIFDPADLARQIMNLL